MARVFLLLALVIVVALIWRTWESRRQRQRTVRRMQQTELIRCDYCGTHVPETKILRLGERCYCSPEHKALDHR